jgi:hypothetical protein
MSGPHSGTPYPLTEQGISLGRADDCEVVLQSQNVSRKHARVFVYQGTPYVQDLGSRNGVFVNGVRVQQQGLQVGDTVTMGEFVFQVASGAVAMGGSSPRRGLLFGVAGAVVIGLIAVIAVVGGGNSGSKPEVVKAPVAPPSANTSMFANLNEPGKVRPPPAAKTPSGPPADGGQEAPAIAVPADQRSQMVKDYLDRAELLQEAGKITEARDFYERALKLDPTNQKALIRKERLDKEIAGRIQRHLDDGMKSFKALRYEEAISSWELVLNLSPDPNSQPNIQATKFIADARAKLSTQQQ